MWSLFLIGHPYLMARLVVKNESCRKKYEYVRLDSF
jgi:hypothetical protein